MKVQCFVCNIQVDDKVLLLCKKKKLNMCGILSPTPQKQDNKRNTLTAYRSPFRRLFLANIFLVYAKTYTKHATYTNHLTKTTYKNLIATLSFFHNDNQIVYVIFRITNISTGFLVPKAKLNLLLFMPPLAMVAGAPFGGQKTNHLTSPRSVDPNHPHLSVCPPFTSSSLQASLDPSHVSSSRQLHGGFPCVSSSMASSSVPNTILSPLSYLGLMTS